MLVKELIRELDNTALNLEKLKKDLERAGKGRAVIQISEEQRKALEEAIYLLQSLTGPEEEER